MMGFSNIKTIRITLNCKGDPFWGGGGGKHCNLERGVFTLHNTATDFGRELSPENFEMVVFVG